MRQILHVIVVGFHHKKGCQIEFCYPPFEGSVENSLPEEWINLPSLALPDGAHNTESDTIYFILPSRETPDKAIFGISCYKQIPAKDLITKSDDVTRSAVQKSVCVLSRIPLYGVLKPKLQLITQAYFNERDFAKVEVLSQMYTNLCDMFESDLVEGQEASMDVPVQEFFIRFRHRALFLFKILLLERKVVFNITPAQLLGDTMLSLVSLFPRLLESGLFFAASCAELHSNSQACCIDNENILEGDPIRNKDSYGFPLSIFTNGNLFHPYLSISYLDAIRSSSVRGFMVGATNALFVTKRDFLDAIVTVDEQGYGQVEIINSDLKRVLALTTADLRFGDYLLKNIEENMKSSAVYQGGDEWLRLQLRSYLLAMAATARSDLQTSVADFGVHFISSWRLTRNYRLWMAGQHEDVSSAAPGHAFAGQIGMYDVLLRMEHSVSGSEGARKAINAISSTGKNIGETGSKFKQSFSSWFKGEVSTDEHVLEDDVLRKELRYGISGSFPNLVAVGNTPSVVMTTTSELEIDQGTSSQMGESRGNILTSWIKTKGHDGEGLGAKVKNLTSWFKGGQNQNDEPNVLTENEIDVKNEQHFK